MPTKQVRTKAGRLFDKRSNKREAAVLNELAVQQESFLYDFDSDGGAVSTISFGASLPANAAILRVWTDTQTAVTSGGSATFQVKAGATTLIAAEGFDDATHGIDATGLIEQITTPKKITAESELSLAIAVAALTAGKVRFIVEYCISE